MSARTKGKDDSLLKDLRKQVADLEDDLRARSESEPEYREKLQAEYRQAREAERTAATYGAWRDERVTQIAAAWVLGCVFVRFCEDNGLVERNWLAGVGERLKDAEDHDQAFFAKNPELNDRDWIIAAFDHLAETNRTVAGLFDRAHNPLWEIEPSYEAATALLKFWRRVAADGEIVHRFDDPELDTRFLGDLYQDLSEHARKTYALLQTPVFVEEFILDLTLEPAVKEFGLTPVVEIHDGHGGVRELPPGLRTIDPACGSGHFLLGIFERMLAKWREAEPGTDDMVLIRRALGAVHGCDKNPFAVAIARFRLLIAVLKAADARRLDALGELPINVAVGDSLLHGRGAETVTESLFTEETFFYRTEDAGAYAESVDLLGKSSYHVVVGNPPYITVKDSQENKNYKEAYDACYRQYALSVPFAQRIFELAIRAGGGQRDGGFTGQITANSFMKREFGKKLIEEFFPKVDLTDVIDTSGAYIPGHGTPTVILAGRNRNQLAADRVRAVLGVRGEPGQPELPSDGLVWQAIVDQHRAPGSESEWISVEDAERNRFLQHPWALGGGGAAPLQAKIESGTRHISELADDIGSGAVTREDSAYRVGAGALRRHGISEEFQRTLLESENLRDYGYDEPVIGLWPYGDTTLEARATQAIERFLWPARVILRGRIAYGKNQLERGLQWFEYSMFFPGKYATPLSLTFGFFGTHNHFTLDRGGNIFNRSAPVIKLSKQAGENQHLELLGVLNSSTACFWLKQVSHDKGIRGEAGGFTSDDWERFYEFSVTKLKKFPVPDALPLALGRELDAIGRNLAIREPSAITSAEAPTRARLDAARVAHAGLRARMIALQEELDWTVYGAYGLLSPAEVSRTTLSGDLADVPGIALGQRAFEIVLARKVRDGEAETVWFTRHGSTPITEIPDEWPDAYKAVVQARIDMIESDKDIRLIERPECKRRWSTDPWEKREKAALRTWLLDRCEDRSLWFHIRDGFEQPRTLTTAQLADELEKRPDAEAVRNTAALYAAHLGKPNLSLAAVLADVTDAEHVPYLAAYRYKESGLRKRTDWEKVWDLQRKEDEDGTRLDIPVPPKYASADFTKQSYWSNRGKLDVPKERFVSYPDASPDADTSLLLGWAGWDHRDQATALLDLVQNRRRQHAWPEERLLPLLAGIAELMPWLRQWFGEVDEEWGEQSAAEELQSFLDGELDELGIARTALPAWRPQKKSKARKATTAAKKKMTKTAMQTEEGAHSHE
ncbi:BREX-2 system adenine-specific DNA-methyltransferase PglX [Streptomyces sp. HNM0574]|uniref:BREX-2 system adenine-specific DNA-methyltransferase PglX n=1 Tax=Streptomyces sp. HNM0574 TaxID=2714954 RepID=UPI00146C37C7|nr:BREX-2 system adenine-specific DNA-methyltransferase PglX [Streptomyces sp. HNM0574]